MNTAGIHPGVSELVSRFGALEEVQGVLMAGSRASGTADGSSDYDLYIYSSPALGAEARRPLLDGLFEYLEFDNRFWETEDDGRLRPDGMPVEILYRDTIWIKDQLDKRLFLHEPGIGYSTCFWASVVNSVILFERGGAMTAMKERYNVPYPEPLRRNIIRLNHALLRGEMSSYDGQIKKALERNDPVSVNHRVAAHLASCFDILFAYNRVPHPGEKRLLTLAKKLCRVLPGGFEDGVKRVLEAAGDGKGLMPALDRLNDLLDEMLKGEFQSGGPVHGG